MVQVYISNIKLNIFHQDFRSIVRFYEAAAFLRRKNSGSFLINKESLTLR